MNDGSHSTLRRHLIGCILTMCLAAGGLPAATPGPDAVPDGEGLAAAGHRPRIGLVLGGGGAKGAAHIGVLGVLDALRVPVDCIAGTSMGALVGGTYATGLPPARIEAAVRAINWADTVGDVSLRRRAPIRRKLDAVTYTNNLEFGIRDGRLRTAPGLVRTQNIEQVLRALVAAGASITDFDDLPIAFRAVATDMVSGRMVVLGDGDLATALRSSMAIPGAFAPVLRDGQVLADGSLMRNLPVDVARDLCADVVIAVSMASTPPQAADLDSALALAGRSLDVMVQANQDAQLATLGPDDVSIVVPVGDIRAGDFDRVPEVIPLGREAALAMREALSRHALPAEAYRRWRAAVDRSAHREVRLAAVRFDGLERVDARYLHATLRDSRPGARVTPAQIAGDVRRLYALGDFDKVDYHIEDEPDAAVLVVDVREKPWGPDFVRFDLGLAASVGGEALFVLRGDHTRTWLDARGRQWRNRVQLGQVSRFETAIYQPLDIAQRYFVEAAVRLHRSAEDIYFDGDRVGEYDFLGSWAQFDAGINFGSRVALRAGLHTGWTSGEVEAGDLRLPRIPTRRETRLMLDLAHDTRNAVALPTDGALGRLRYTHAGALLGGETRFEKIDGLYAQTVPFRGDALTLSLAGGRVIEGPLPPIDSFRLGGLYSFPGLKHGELRGDEYWLTSANYGWKLGDIQSLFGQALYAGLRLTVARVGGRFDDEREGTLHGAALSLYGSSPLGPFQLSFGAVDNGALQLQFGLGRPVEEGSILDLSR